MNNEASRGAAAQSGTVKPTGCGFDLHSRRWNIYLNLYFHFFALVSRQSLPLNTKCLQKSAESGKRSVLTLGFLCLPCYVRDTAWSWFFFIKRNKTDTCKRIKQIASIVHTMWQRNQQYNFSYTTFVPYSNEISIEFVIWKFKNITVWLMKMCGWMECDVIT